MPPTSTGSPLTLVNVCFCHIADVPLALTNVRFGGKADMTQTGRYVG